MGNLNKCPALISVQEKKNPVKYGGAMRYGLKTF